MTPAQLSRALLLTVRRAVDEGELCLGAGGVPERVVVESPPRRGSGDYAVRVALPLARAAGRSPYEVAVFLRERLLREPGVGRVEVEGTGFLHVSLDDRGRAQLVRDLAVAPGRTATTDSLSTSTTPVTPTTAPPGGDAPAADIRRWSCATGEEPGVLAVRTRESSLFRVQYAHARARALLRNARDLGLRPEAGAAPLRDPRELALLGLLADHDRIAEEVGAGSGPARLARHLTAVSDAFFDFHDARAPLPSGDEKPGAAHRARLALVEATGTVLAGGLAQLGVTAPDHI